MVCAVGMQRSWVCDVENGDMPAVLMEKRVTETGQLRKTGEKRKLEL